MYMILNISFGIFVDDFLKEEEEEQIEEILKVVFLLKLEKMIFVIQNMLIFRYIREYILCKKFVICIIVWDKIIRFLFNKDFEEYLKDEFFVLYNFIKFYFLEVLFFGISV